MITAPGEEREGGRVRGREGERVGGVYFADCLAIRRLAMAKPSGRGRGPKAGRQ